MSGDPRWTFGVEPLPQQTELAPLLRRMAGLVLSLEREDPAVARLIDELRAAEQALAGRVATDRVPRLGEDAPADGRPYVDHARDIGAYNPCFPEYDLVVDGAGATGSVTFPLAFEGPPGIVHGGVLATFFDCAVQHHNCDLGVAGKTTSLLVEFRRPAPIDVPLAFEIHRETDERRISSRVELARGDERLCTATVEAIAGELGRLPHVPPREATP
jgi:hypothetical protein